MSLLSAGVRIGKKDVPDFDLISTGDFISPATWSFKLTDSGASLEQIKSFYFIISNTEVERISLQVSGLQTAVRLSLSLDNVIFSDTIIINEHIDALGLDLTRSFFAKVVVDDLVDFFVFNQITISRAYKLRLLFA